MHVNNSARYLSAVALAGNQFGAASSDDGWIHPIAGRPSFRLEAQDRTIPTLCLTAVSLAGNL